MSTGESANNIHSESWLFQHILLKVLQPLPLMSAIEHFKSQNFSRHLSKYSYVELGTKTM